MTKTDNNTHPALFVLNLENKFFKGTLKKAFLIIMSRSQLKNKMNNATLSTYFENGKAMAKIAKAIKYVCL